jgi:Uncharacterized protein conserved in bacteria (DUF2188)
MQRNHIHVVPQGDKWVLKEENKSEPISLHGSQDEAIAAGKPIAQLHKTELVIHRPNGQIREAWSYGNDPVSSVG